ncbi:DUF1206 domain-containing protein [Dulcicalothrix desertica]|uniref:DUF1206 domain-containing protein n=1 Tax=Dulcicalothrix desertica TaxID=32056 RepID=UPI0022787571|nr:DUF1206 domain-containing protein [Dulcicalothrix desertica]
MARRLGYACSAIGYTGLALTAVKLIMGLGGALAILAQQPFGAWLLSAVALGLTAYGIYSLLESRYRRIANL